MGVRPRQKRYESGFRRSLADRLKATFQGIPRPPYQVQHQVQGFWTPNFGRPAWATYRRCLLRPNESRGTLPLRSLELEHVMRLRVSWLVKDPTRANGRPCNGVESLPPRGRAPSQSWRISNFQRNTDHSLASSSGSSNAASSWARRISSSRSTFSGGFPVNRIFGGFGELVNCPSFSNCSR